MSETNVTQEDRDAAADFTLASGEWIQEDLLAVHMANHAQAAVAKREAEIVEFLKRFDVLPAVNRAMQWPEVPPWDVRWEKAVCSAASRVQLQIIQAIENNLIQTPSEGA